MLKKFLHRRFNWLRDVNEPTQAYVAFELHLGTLHVATLRREGDEWVFAYTDAFREQTRIIPIVDFPQVDREYRSKELWPFFALRIPSVTQTQVQRHIKHNSLDMADAVELMQKFGRRSIANPFVLESV